MKPFTVLIPSRYASVRLPAKSLADIGGAPMVVRVAQCALLSGATRVFVATDDQRIVDACHVYDIETIMTHSNHVTGTDRLAEAATQLNLADDEIVVNLQGDEPLMLPEAVAAVAQCLEEAVDSQMSTVACPLRTTDDFLQPSVVKLVRDVAGRAIYFSRAPIPWPRDIPLVPNTPLPQGIPTFRHVGLYAYRAAFLKKIPTLPAIPLESCESLEQLRVLAYGERIAVHVMDVDLAGGVDTLEDLQRVQALWCNR